MRKPTNQISALFTLMLRFSYLSYIYWHSNWEGLMLLYGYPKGMTKVIYITNTIELLSNVIRTMVNKRKMFPSDQAAFKVVYLAT